MGNHFVAMDSSDWWQQVYILVELNKTNNCFFGVALHSVKDATKKTISSIPAVFVDVDFKDSSKEASRERIAALKHLPCPLEPSLYVLSGNGVHVYFLLKEPLQLSAWSVEDSLIDIATCEMYNVILASLVGGDPNATDATRILRIPGTQNFKYSPSLTVRAYASKKIPAYDTTDFPEKVSKRRSETLGENARLYPCLPTSVSPASSLVPSVRHPDLQSGKYCQGRRDIDLFHLANTLAKGNMQEADICTEVMLMAKHCNPPMDPKVAWIKVQSALNRQKDRGKYDVMDIFKIKDPGVFLDIRWPLRIEQWVSTYPGNICVVAGEPNVGKTAFLLRFTANQLVNPNFPMPLHYFNSEMDSAELRMRIDFFQMVLSDWKGVTFHRRSNNFPEAIVPGACNIIDYLEVHDSFYAVGGILNSIHEKLHGGIAIIALQKNPGRDQGLGGYRGLEKPRLYMSLSTRWPGGVLKMVKAKNWRQTGKQFDPNGLLMKYEITDASTFIERGQWGRTLAACDQQAQSPELPLQADYMVG